MDFNKIYQGDSFELIKQLPNNSIDLIVTSPPYCDIKSYGKKVNILHPDNYVEWILPLFNEMYRVIKPSGSIIFNIGDKTLNKEKHIFIFDMICRIKRETELQYYDRYIWYCPRIPNGSKKRLNNFTEWIFHFTKDKNQIKFNMDDIRKPYKEISIKRYKNNMIDYEVLSDGTKVIKKSSLKSLNPKGKTPDGLLKFPNNSKTKGNKHPAPFSIDLPKWFIIALTNKNDIVFDPFIGSGTTAVACIETDRNYIGFELNPTYIDMSENRISKIGCKTFNEFFE